MGIHTDAVEFTPARSLTDSLHMVTEIRIQHLLLFTQSKCIKAAHMELAAG